jgi:transposase-like protein
MDRQAYTPFFLQPTGVWHRRYEALRSVFVEQQPLSQVADGFGITCGTVRNWVSEFRGQRDGGQPGEVLQFVEFWHDLTRKDPQWLYFDSRLTTAAELSQLAERGIWFVTIRRRGKGILRHLDALPENAWQKATIDIPKRRHQQILYVDEHVKVANRRLQFIYM